MKKLTQIIPLVILAVATGAAQQPQTQTAPVFPVNAKYANGVAPGYAPTPGSGLTLNLSGGTANCSGIIAAYTAGTLTMTASAANYVYLDTAGSCAPAAKTTSFASADIPIAVVTTNSTAIVAGGITDVRTMFQRPGGTTSGLNDPGSNGIVKRTATNTTGIATQTDIANTWTDSTCISNSYLKKDGTCETPTGSGIQYNSTATNYVFTGASTGMVAGQCQIAGNQQDAVSSYSIASNVLTVAYTGNQPNVGDVLMGSLFGASTFLNGAKATVTTATSSAWSASLSPGHADVTTTTEAGVMACADNYPSQASQMEYMSGHGTMYNQSIAGTTIAAIDSAYSTLLHPYVNANSWVIITPTGNEWGGTGCPSAESVEPSYQSVWAKIHADGGRVLELTPTGTAAATLYCSAAPAIYQALNTWMRAQGGNSTNAASGQYWDKVITADAIIANNADGQLIQQSGALAGHLTPGGARLVAEAVNASLAGKVSIVGVNVHDAFAPSSLCGANNIPCTNTSNTFSGTQIFVASDGANSPAILQQASSSVMTPSIVQGGGAQNQTLSGVAVGHSLLVACASTYNIGGYENVSDNQLNIYTPIMQYRPYVSFTLALAPVTTGGTITPVCSGGSNYIVWELANAGSADGTYVLYTTATWGGGSPNATSITTTDSSDLIITSFMPGGQSSSSLSQTVSGWITDYTDSNTILNQHRYGGPATYNSSFSFSGGGSQLWGMIVAIHGVSLPQSADLLPVLDASGAALGAGIDKDGNWRGAIGSSETIAFSATPTFSTAVRSSYITLAGNITSFSLPSGIDGQEKTLCFKQDGTGGHTVAAPANVLGFFSVGSTAATTSCQHFTYFAGPATWLADSAGVVN